MNDDTAHDSSKRPSSSGLPSTNINVVDLLEKIRQQMDELESERQQRLNLERQLCELARQNEMQFTDHQIHVQKIIKNTQDEQSLLKQQLHEARLQSEKDLPTLRKMGIIQQAQLVIPNSRTTKNNQSIYWRIPRTRTTAR